MEVLPKFFISPFMSKSTGVASKLALCSAFSKLRIILSTLDILTLQV